MKLKIGYVIFAIVVIMTMTTITHGHESDGFKHMSGSSGSIIKAKFCGDGTTVWWVDENNDGMVDVCKKALLNHERLHIKLSEPINNECTCEETDDE